MVISIGMIIYGYLANDNHHIQQIGIGLLLLSAYSYAVGFKNQVTNAINLADSIVVPINQMQTTGMLSNIL